MKKLDKLVIKSFVGPLILTFVVAVFVLLMQFIWKYVDDIAGKGLSVGIILELLMDASATFVPMAMPIAVLFASIMTMGNLGEHYELVAIKSGGIPLWRSMVPMGIIVAVLTVVAFIFADYVLTEEENIDVFPAVFTNAENNNQYQQNAARHHRLRPPFQFQPARHSGCP